MALCGRVSASACTAGTTYRGGTPWWKEKMSYSSYGLVSDTCRKAGDNTSKGTRGCSLLPELLHKGPDTSRRAVGGLGTAAKSLLLSTPFWIHEFVLFSRNMLHLILKCTSKQENSMPKRFFNILSNHLVGELQLSSSHNTAFGGSNQINLMSCMSLGSRESSTQTVRTFPIQPMGNFSLPSILAQKQDFKRRDRRQYMALGRNASNFQSSYGCHIIKKKKKVMAGKMVYAHLWAVGKLGSRWWKFHLFLSLTPVGMKGAFGVTVCVHTLCHAFLKS